MTTPQKTHETSMEAESRKAANFPEVEQSLLKKFASSEMSYIDKATSLLGTHNPFGKKATAEDYDLWLLDNTAFRPVNEDTYKLDPWQAEFVAAYFHKGRKDLTKAVSNIVDTIGLDGDVGSDPEVLKTIEERLGPFVQAIAPARTCEIVIPSPGGPFHTRKLGPSNPNGISSQVFLTGGGTDGADNADGKSTSCYSATKEYPEARNVLQFAGPEGWAIVSDIDDTIKTTITTNPIEVLKKTFVEQPQAVAGMPELYKSLHQSFNKPAWFYLSASPYNLYPFLHEFIGNNFEQGTIVLRDSSWMFFAGLLQSLTEGVEEYKRDRLEKIHSWLPKRKVICIGDSTQSDPEAYAATYKKFPGWIKAIFIRKVTDTPFMERKNADKRFQDAFTGVPESVWKVFEDPAELHNSVKHLTGELH